MSVFPVFVDVGRTPPLVIGNGDMAIAKVQTLLTRAPRVSLAASKPPPLLVAAIKAGAVELLGQAPTEDDIRGRPLVVAASGDHAGDARIAAIARALGVPVNVPDKPELCTFTFGAFILRGDVTVAISTDGAAPILATHLRGWLEQQLHPRLGRIASIAREFRSVVSKRVPMGAPRRTFWQQVLTGASAKAILAGDEARGRQLIEVLLSGVNPQPTPGRVILVGAGPGDPELLTLKAVRALKSADLILHDSLIGDRILDYARREARIVCVGKRRGQSGISQREINALMIAQAREGRIVVRLKGGDAFIFGRAAEEIAAIHAAGITLEVIAGITAAQACAADAGLPLTYRGRVRQLSLVTGAASDGEPDLDWEALARPGQAFAIYMGVHTASAVTRQLIAAGADPTMSVIIVENGGRPQRRTIATTLADLPDAVAAKAVRGPAIMFVGLAWADAGLAMPADVERFEVAPTPAMALGNWRGRRELPAPHSPPSTSWSFPFGGPS
jgi:uroporphyrin-III C-methyltransferase/precorrin-2 dehydrogenase/sirohydrochlorin ferrochelatase